MTNAGGTPAGWHPDPHARYEQRWFDGTQWTPHVATRGVTTTESSDDWAYATGVSSPDQVHQQVTRAAQDRDAGAPGSRSAAPGANPASAPTGAPASADASAGGGTIFTEPVLVVNQKAKVFEVTNEYAVYDQHGRQIGAVRQIGQSVGSINAENWQAWNFSIRDVGGTEVARITKTWEGFAKAMFTTADNYVVALHRPLEEPLRSLVVASALSVDTALKKAEG